MTSPERTPAHTAQDLTFELARDRIASLHASAAPLSQAYPATDRRLLDRLRDALGRRLIGLGTALAADEGLRRRVLRP